ncbi:MAG: HAMP domain-containing histidine kinase [Oscillospiraceae bacterium]|nr:HAMP domain-containing histidine kinase [Oscillospiraceae bacterium]
MMKGKLPRKLLFFKEKISLLAILVVMVFAILLVSSLLAGFVSYLLITYDIMPFLQFEESVEVATLYMIIVSLLIGTILARFFGGRFLRQIKELADATKAVAAGNFDVRIKGGGTKEIDLIRSSFNSMVKELADIETLRMDFVNNVSHEFKTPVASIRGFARRLKKNSLTAQQRNEYLDIIISESERLTRLSSNVLLLSRLENTEKIIERVQFRLDEQLRRTILLMEPQLLKKSLEVDIELSSVSIVANEEMLSDLWINLLSNAIKFSFEASTIRLRLTSTQTDAIVSLSDEGIGMDEKMQKHIFDKFYQGDKSRATEGNGLGLTLVKRILELENGRIEVDSTLGKGTTFKVLLPMIKQ